jgi:hypothetical protein
LLRILETQMFMLPTMITMTIAATRMYRGLADYCSHSDMCVILPLYYSPCSPQSCNNSIAISGTPRVPRSGHPVTLPPRDTGTLTISTHDRPEVTVSTTSLPSPRDKGVSFVTMEGERGDKPLGLSPDDGAESNV